IAENEYFVPKRPTVHNCWRILRTRLIKEGLVCPSRRTFARFIKKLVNEKEATRRRRGDRAAYALGRAERSGINWIVAPDYADKVEQMDGKVLDLQVRDEETGVVLGRP